MRREQMHMMLDLLLDMGQRLVARPVPPAAKQHFESARRETLLGVRALIDAAIERTSQPQTTTEGAAKIIVE